MHWIDFTLIILYMAGMLGIGFYFLKRNKGSDDYYVGGREMGPWHIGLSVVATDVGGGFSIGLGGLGFLFGISGSWMLFTGLLGAWISSVLIIPKVFPLSHRLKFLTFPQIFTHFFNKKVGLMAGIISAIGYMGFTSSQLLAGAKLASATFPALEIKTALVIIGIIAVVYTFMGGLKAVIYTDTVQWILLLSGLILIGIPVSFFSVGGFQGLKSVLGPEFFSITNVSWQQLVNWGVTIIPIWFVGMTLYQRIYASRSEKDAKKAWLIAGLLEYPVMAFMGVILGLISRVAFEQGMFAYLGFPAASALDSEMGLPMLLRTVLPTGLLGIMLSAYFSAIMSTADSCLMAASGNVLTDILGIKTTHKHNLRISQFLTLGIGVAALLLATFLDNVLELMLYSYAFMVSGLVVPTLGAFYAKYKSPAAAFLSMLFGGGTTLALTVFNVPLPFGLDPNIFGLSLSALTFFMVTSITKPGKTSWQVWNLAGTLLILLIPFVAMQITEEVNWGPMDFITAGILIFGAGSMALFITRRVRNRFYRIAAILAVIALLLLIWAQLAVGIIS